MFNNRPALKTGSLNPDTVSVKTQDDLPDAKFNDLLFLLRDTIQKNLLTDSNGEVPFTENGQINKMIETYFNDALVEFITRID